MKIRDNIIAINHWPERYGKKIQGIVLHSMWGNYSGTLAWFNNPESSVSAHYCIKDDGEITMCVPEKAAAWHAGNVTVRKEDAPQVIKENWGVNPNLITIGIEMEDKRQADWIYPDRQYQAVVELVADICRRNNIIPNRGTIMMHKETDPRNKADPHGRWDHPEFVQDVRHAMEDDGLWVPSKVEVLLKPITVMVTSKLGLNVREGWDIASKIQDVLFYKEKVDVMGYVQGEKIDGEDGWWQTDKGLFIWSGGTDIKPSELEKKGGVLLMTRDEFEQIQQKLDDRKASLIDAREQIDEKVGQLEEEMARLETLETELEADIAALEEVTVVDEGVEEEEEIEEEVEETPEAPPEEVNDLIDEIRKVLAEASAIEIKDSTPPSTRAQIEKIKELAQRVDAFAKRND